MSKLGGQFQASSPCMWMRGGSSKGGYFLAEDLPADPADRNRFLLSIMGSPDSRQIDGMGGADPLTSKVAVVKKSTRANIDIDYLFLQVFVDQALVSDAQNCGNILAGVAPFAIERGLVDAQEKETSVTIFMENTGQIAKSTVQTPQQKVTYHGEASLDSVPGLASPIAIEFLDTAGSSCGALFPTGQATNTIDGIDISCIDNGMPVVLIRAQDLGITGYESREALDQNSDLKEKLESIRLQAGPLMNLGDVRKKSVPKMTLITPAKNNGVINTRTFIPHRCHASIGVLGAVSVATACAVPDTIAFAMANTPQGSTKTIGVEHPIGSSIIQLKMDGEKLGSTAVISTARKLFDGIIFASE